MKLVKLLVLVLAMACLCACSSMKQKPILTPDLQVASVFPGMAEDDVEKAILAACNERGWRIDAAQDGQIEASIHVRNKHHVSVRIPYSAQSVRIEYKESVNMLYDGTKNVIHRGYNRWVNNLLHDIQTKLTAVSNSRIVK